MATSPLPASRVGREMHRRAGRRARAGRRQRHIDEDVRVIDGARRPAAHRQARARIRLADRERRDRAVEEHEARAGGVAGRGDVAGPGLPAQQPSSRQVSSRGQRRGWNWITSQPVSALPIAATLAPFSTASSRLARERPAVERRPRSRWPGPSARSAPARAARSVRPWSPPLERLARHEAASAVPSATAIAPGHGSAKAAMRGA